MDRPDQPVHPGGQRHPGHAVHAGWFPDPTGQVGQRYYDGQRWTEHFAPAPPPSAVATPSVAVAVSSGGGANHALHAVLTFLSCGLWLPTWILVAIFDSGRGSSAVIAGGVGASAGTSARSNHKPVMIVAAVFLGLAAIGAAAEHPWILVLLILVAGAGGALFWVRKSAQEREKLEHLERYRRDVLASRADYEDALWHQGDPRGIYGQFMPPESLRGARRR
jgi:hypothetical protein